MTLPTALPSSTGTRHRTHTVLIDQYSFGMRSIGCSSTHLLLKLFLIYGSVFVSSSLRLPPMCTSTSLGAISLPCLLPCSGLLSRQRLIHSTWRYFAGTQAASVLRLCLRLPFLFFLLFLLFLFFLFFLFFFSFFSLLSRGLPPRMHIKLPWGHLSMAGGLAEGN